ncbi:hypothetical protein BCR34DRAFT_363365 [Clohesyomyces aquaticus]|uniref:Uncharacterized protein n=1 Tax=Clohesyomyces aquaticus TaxID=1231657 RepID=A0A1Y1ZJA8_9PLEO|nr:hypothetical protein BCR34DRAFT_363365 [Clohesyomyces aquaticus]
MRVRRITYGRVFRGERARTLSIHPHLHDNYTVFTPYSRPREIPQLHTTQHSTSQSRDPTPRYIRSTSTNQSTLFHTVLHTNFHDGLRILETIRRLPTAHAAETGSTTRWWWRRWWWVLERRGVYEDLYGIVWTRKGRGFEWGVYILVRLIDGRRDWLLQKAAWAMNNECPERRYHYLSLPTRIPTQILPIK